MSISSGIAVIGLPALRDSRSPSSVRPRLDAVGDRVQHLGPLARRRARPRRERGGRDVDRVRDVVRGRRRDLRDHRSRRRIDDLVDLDRRPYVPSAVCAIPVACGRTRRAWAVAGHPRASGGGRPRRWRRCGRPASRRWRGRAAVEDHVEAEPVEQRGDAAGRAARDRRTRSCPRRRRRGSPTRARRSTRGRAPSRIVRSRSLRIAWPQASTQITQLWSPLRLRAGTRASTRSSRRTGSSSSATAFSSRAMSASAAWRSVSASSSSFESKW